MVKKELAPPSQAGEPQPDNGDGEVHLASLEITSLNVQQLASDEASDAELIRENAVSVMEASGRVVRLKLSERLFFKPGGPFKLDLEVMGSFIYPRPVKEEDIQPQSEDLVAPLLAYGSFVIAFVTQQLNGVPIVLPPVLS